MLRPPRTRGDISSDTFVIPARPSLPVHEEPALPRWPFTLLFVGFPVWWLLGPGEAVWIVIAAIMVFYLIRNRAVEVPRGFGLWALFLVWMLCSVVAIDSGTRLIGFSYRALLYASVTVVFLYVYNARQSLTPQYVAGVLTTFWLVVVVGGYLGVFFPLFAIDTPLGLVLPESIRSNELVGEMIRRRSTQFDPDAYYPLSPRPSAPFLYTNGWGNAYSLLMPFVIAYLALIRRTRRFWWLLAAVPASFVPAFLTLNRGMFLGLAVAVVFALVVFVLRGQFTPVLVIAGLLVVVALAVAVLPVAERLTERLDTSSTTEDRFSLYTETIDRTLESPLFGYGAPRPSESAGAPAAGTQGQFWMVLFSTGIPGAILFMSWWVVAFFRSIRDRGWLGLAGNVVLLLIVIESFYYGTLTVGIMIGMIAAALSQRPTEPEGALRAPRRHQEEGTR